MYLQTHHKHIWKLLGIYEILGAITVPGQLAKNNAIYILYFIYLFTILCEPLTSIITTSLDSSFTNICRRIFLPCIL